MRTCATSGTSDQTSVVTGLPESASKVAAPTKCSAPGVGTTRTSWPASVNSRSSRAALYAATPPLTPSTMRLTASILPVRERTRQRLPGALPNRGWARPGSRPERARGGKDGVLSVLAGGVGEQALVDLAQRDRQRLLLRGRVDERADVLEQALGELAVVGVDLPRALGGEDHQAVLAAGALEQLVDRRIGDALGVGCDSGHVRAGSSVGGGSAAALAQAGGRRRSQQAYQLVGGPGHVVVDHHGVELPGGVQLRLCDGQPALLHLRRLGPAAGQPAHQRRPGRRGEEDQLRLRRPRAHLARALQLDLQQSRRPGRETLTDRGGGGAVTVACVLGPLEQAVLGDQPVEVLVGDEVVVDPVHLAGTAGPRGDRHRDPHVGVPLPDLRDHGALADPRGAGEHGQPCRGAISHSSILAGAGPRPASGGDLLPAELLLQRLALVGAQAADAARRGDLQALHDLGRAGLAHAGQGLQDGGDPHLADHLVGLALLEDVADGRTLALELLAELRTGLAGRGGLLESGGTLFWGERREGHGCDPIVSSPAVMTRRVGCCFGRYRARGNEPGDNLVPGIC